MSDSADTASAIWAAESRGYEVEILGPHALRVTGRFGEPTLGALEVMLEAGAPIGVWAEGIDGGCSALCLWTGEDLYAITLGENGRWEHFRADTGLGAVRDSWRSGDRSRRRVPHGPLMREIPEAVEIAQAWGFPTPTTYQPTPPPKTLTRSTATRAPREASARPAARSTRAASTAGRATAPEPVAKVCPRCFMVLPATGRCDYCA